MDYTPLCLLSTHALATIVNVSAETVNNDAFAPVTSAYLQLSGYLLQGN